MIDGISIGEIGMILPATFQEFVVWRCFKSSPGVKKQKPMSQDAWWGFDEAEALKLWTKRSCYFLPLFTLKRFLHVFGWFFFHPELTGSRKAPKRVLDQLFLRLPRTFRLWLYRKKTRRHGGHWYYIFNLYLDSWPFFSLTFPACVFM